MFAAALGDEKKTKKKSKKLFDSSKLKCLVCESLVDEFKYEISKVDPRKMVETGTFRVDGKGEQAKTSVNGFEVLN
jgi:hypothetical protein